MRRLEVNLARRSFVNGRPVVHAAVFLWLLAVGLGGSSFVLYRNYFVGSGEKGRRLAELDRELALERDRVTDLNTRVAGLNLAQQNQTALFLNAKIMERTLSWGRLADHLAGMLPGDVRLISMAPELKGRSTDKDIRDLLKNVDQEHRPVTLSIRGEAKNDEARSLFLRRLFEDPVFSNADLRSEINKDGEPILFDITASYRPWVLDEMAPTALHAGSAEQANAPAAVEEDK